MNARKPNPVKTVDHVQIHKDPIGVVVRTAGQEQIAEKVQYWIRL